MWRQFRPVIWLYNFVNYSKLMCSKLLYQRWQVKPNFFYGVKASDFPKNTEDIPWLDKTDATNALQNHPSLASFDAAIQEKLLAWPSQGYMILPNFFNDEQVAIINGEIDKLKQKRQAKYRLDHRVFNAIHQSELLRNTVNTKWLNDLLSFILGKEALLFQSLNFELGSQQKIHSDSIHMTTYPQGYLLAAWIALEDISADSGPLTYYPGSHTLPYVMSNDFPNKHSALFLDRKAYHNYEHYIENMITEKKLQAKQFLAKKGDVFIWHANLLHGGSAVIGKNATRKSMVLHYYAKDVICFHEITQRPAIFNDKDAHCAPPLKK